MCGDCQRRAETNPLRVLDCKVPEDQPIIDTLPSILDYLDEDCRTHFRSGARVSGRPRHRLRSEAAPGARARLLHAHDVRDRARRAWRPELRAGRRPLRRPGGSARLESSRAWHRLFDRRGSPGDERGRRSPADLDAGASLFIAPMGEAADRHAALLAAEIASARRFGRDRPKAS